MQYSFFRAVFSTGTSSMRMGARHLRSSLHIYATLFFVVTFLYQATQFLILPLQTAHAGTQIGTSLRLNSSGNAYLSRSPASVGSQTTWTWSAWVKPSRFASQQPLYSVFSSTTNYGVLGFSLNGYVNANDSLHFVDVVSNASVFNLETTALFRDPSAWYHIVAVVDTTQATASNRVRLYVNGSQITSFATAVYPSQNAAVGWFNATNSQQIGALASGTYGYFDGYMSDVYFVDGQALAPTSFGAIDTTTGAWVPSLYTGTYGTNGYHLTFGNSGALGTDSSANGNTWTANSITSIDYVYDSPSHTFATWSAVNRLGSSVGVGTLAKGGLSGVPTAANAIAASTIALPRTGKWFAEVLWNSGSYPVFGIANQNHGGGGAANNIWGYYANGGNGLYFANGPTGNAGANAPNTVGDLMLVAVDVSANKIWIGRNRSGTIVWMGGGDPSTGTTPTFSGSGGGGAFSTSVDLSTNDWYVAIAGGGTWEGIVGFGGGGMASVSYQSSAGGYFNTTVPAGFKALSTANMPTPAIQKPNSYFDAKIYNGTGAVQSITGLNFVPTLTWIKDRTAANAHGLFDSIRTAFPYWSSNASTVETGTPTALTSFNSGGFTVGSNALFNTSGNSYISWNWLRSTTSGVDVVTYTGTGANQTISHNLGAIPAFIIVKRRDVAADPVVFHQNTTNANWYLDLASTAAQTGDATVFVTTPTSSSFQVGTHAAVNASGGLYVAYVFAEKDGFSKFGTYTGNGRTDGPFVYTGFRPRYIMMKRFDAASGWFVVDTARSPFNPVALSVYGESTQVENGTATAIDILSNGFKQRDATAGYYNVAGATYVYAAFADIPFQQSAQPYNLSIASSTRFNGTNAYLTRTPSVVGNRQIWTLSFWVKRSTLVSGTYELFSVSGRNPSAGNMYSLRMGVDNLARWGNSQAGLQSTAVFRDPSHWYHVVVQMDTTQATAANRERWYVDNQQITSFSSASYPAQNWQWDVNNTVFTEIGRYAYDQNQYFGGYLSDFYLIDGQALTPSSFGEYDANGFWRPKAYSGTYGTNGFHVPLTNAAAPGTDTSGNSNSFTANNIATTDNVMDSPTNNFATWFPEQGGQTWTFSNGNLTTVNGNGGSAAYSAVSTVGVSINSGKWYWEVVSGVAGPSTLRVPGIGIIDPSRYILNSAATVRPDVYLSGNGTIDSSSGTALQSGFANMAANDVVGVAVDTGAKTVQFYRNGSAVGTAQAYTPNTVSPSVYSYSGYSFTANFGQGGQSGLTYYSAAGGYFKYAPPTGFKALSTANMPTPAVTQPNSYFDAKTYTGTGAAQNITGLAFTPTITWVKDRTAANAHGIFDSLRMTYPYLSSNATSAETSNATTLSSFISGGFTLGNNSLFNTNANNYVSWNWKESVVSGFDIVTGIKSSASQTFTHSLGAVPAFMIVKGRGTSTSNWLVYHQNANATPQSGGLALEQTAAFAANAGYWNSTAPTSSQFTLGSFTPNEPFVAYLFSEVPGFSKFGTYTGNGSADGPFVYTGFKPRWVIVKDVTGVNNWFEYDTAVSSYNPTQTTLMPNTSGAEIAAPGNSVQIDVLSNGYKVRGGATNVNTNGNVYIYAAYADVPFKYATAGVTSATSMLFMSEF